MAVFEFEVDPLTADALRAEAHGDKAAWSALARAGRVAREETMRAVEFDAIVKRVVAAQAFKIDPLTAVLRAEAWATLARVVRKKEAMMAVEFDAIVKRVVAAQKVDSQTGEVGVKVTVTLEIEDLTEGNALIGELGMLQHKATMRKVRVA